MLRVVGLRWHKYGIRIACTGYLNRMYMSRYMSFFTRNLYEEKISFSFFFFFYIKNNFSAAQAGNSHQPIHPTCLSETFLLFAERCRFFTRNFCLKRRDGGTSKNASANNSNRNLLRGTILSLNI